MSTSPSVQPYESQSSPVQNPLKTLVATKASARLRDCLLLGIIASVLRFAGLTHQSLWFDEGYTLTLVSAGSLHDFVSKFANFTTSEHLQPLYYLLMFGWSRIAGTSDLALRLPSAVASIVSCFLLYDIALQIVPARRSLFALTLAIGFSLSSYSVFYAQDARPYAMVQCLAFAVLASWIHLRYPSEKEHTPDDLLVRVFSNRLFFAIVLLVACFVSVFNLLLVLSLMLADGCLIKSVKQWRGIWVAPFLVGSVVISMYIYFAHQIFPTFIAHDTVSIKQPLWMNIAYALYGIVFGTSLAPADSYLRSALKAHIVLSYWPLLLPGVLTLAVAFVAAIFLFRERRGLSRLSITLAIASCIYAVGLFICFGVFGHLNILPRHASSLFVLLVVLAVSNMACLEEFPLRGHLSTKMLLAAVVGIVLCNIASLYRYIADPELRKDDYRQIAQRIPDDGLHTYLIEGQPLLFEHYGVATLPAMEVPPASLAFYLHSTSGSAPLRLIVNKDRNHLWDNQPKPSTMISAMYSCTQEQALSHMDVERCVPRPSGFKGAVNHAQ